MLSSRPRAKVCCGTRSKHVYAGVPVAREANACAGLRARGMPARARVRLSGQSTLRTKIFAAPQGAWPPGVFFLLANCISFNLILPVEQDHGD